MARLTGELEAVREVTKQREMDAQRTKMIIRLKEDKIARLQVGCAAQAPDKPTSWVLQGVEGCILGTLLNCRPALACRCNVRVAKHCIMQHI